jgi:hypothetical protein
MLKKRISLIAFILVVGSALFAGDKKGPQFKWDEDQYDYGTIYLDDMPETKMDIKFSNTGDAPLVLSNVRACCGTRVTEWPREPILPGEEGTIKIEFRLAQRPHRISRTVIATSNVEGNNNHIFRIRGEVAHREE